MPPFDLERLQDHDEQEWDAFFRFFELRLYHFARRFSAAIGDETARDLVQDSLLAAYEEICGRRTRLQEGGRYMTTWLFGICKNRCRDFVKTADLHSLKQLQLQQDPTIPLPLGQAPTVAVDAQDLAIDGLVPCLDCLPDEQAKELVRNGLSPLPGDTATALVAGLNHASPPLRAALLLRFVVGLKQREIAALLGISLEAVKARLHDAIPPLRQRLERLGATLQQQTA